MHAKDVAIVHGPPGTGKTTTLVEAIYETLHRENQVMVCAQSNMAVDWISEKLVDRGIPVLRIGNPTRVNDKMLSFTYERRFESHPDYPQLWSIRKAIRELYSRSRKGAERENIRLKINSLKDRATELEIRINEALFSEARVIACTLVSSANRVLTGRRFGTLFIDEAAQALEPACWIAIRKADRIVLAGDHCQLPPTIKCIEAARGGLDHTLMEKVVQQKSFCRLAAQSAIPDARGNHALSPPNGSTTENWKPHRKCATGVILDFDTPMNWIDKLERRYGNLGIPNLINGLLIGQLAAGIIMLFFNRDFGSLLMLSRTYVLHGQIWRLITLFVPAHLAGRRLWRAEPAVLLLAGQRAGPRLGRFPHDAGFWRWACWVRGSAAF